MIGALESFEEGFEEYADYLFGTRSSTTAKGDEVEKIRRQLQRKEPAVTDILCKVRGNLRHNLDNRQTTTTRHLLIAALLGGNNAMVHNFRGSYALVTASVQGAIGTLEADLWSPGGPEPTLSIRDTELRERCFDLLSAAGNFDRVVREATLVLEDRIRRKPPHDVLAQLIPRSADLTLENMVNHLFSPDRPVLSVSNDRQKRIALHRILLGVTSYLRNEYHHELDDETEWSWAWSTVGLMDRLLLEVDSCDFVPPNPTTAR